MLAWVSLPQQWVMTTWNKQMTNILARKPAVALKSSEKGQTTSYTAVIFYLKDFVSGVGIMLLKFRLLCSPDIFWNHASWSQKAWKRGNLEVYIVNIYICTWLSRCGSFGIASVLQQFHATSTCCILSFNFIGGTSVLEFLQPFFLVTVRPTVAQSQRSCLTLNLWVPPDFRLFGVFEDENGQEFFVLT